MLTLRSPIPDLPFDLDAARAMAATNELREVAAVLRAAGLREQSIRACYDLVSVAHMPLRMRRALEPPATPAAVLPWLFVAGRAVEASLCARALNDTLPVLERLGLVTTTRAQSQGGDDLVTATVALLPIGDALVACEHIDHARGADTVIFPDDSAFHLLSSLPARRVDRWLDVATGCGVVALSAFGRAREIRATDINPRALVFAQLGAWLSGADNLELVEADLVDGAAGAGPWDLITFNPPIPGEVSLDDITRADLAGIAPEDMPIYYRSPPGAALIERFWAAAPELVAPDGEVIVHSYHAPELLDSLSLPGSLRLVRYTPVEQPLQYGMSFWRPAGPTRTTHRWTTLTLDRPFITYDSGLDD